MEQTSLAIKEVADLNAEAADIAARHKAVMDEIAAKRSAAKGEAVNAVANIIEQFGLTTADVYLPAPIGAAKDRARKPAGPRGVVQPKYMSADGSKTWAGRGKRPAWYVAALAAGQSSESMLIPITRPSE